jgi:hypothetical protein
MVSYLQQAYQLVTCAAPPGLPGSNPDDFTGMGPSRQDAWNDIGPPPGGFPGMMPGRRGRGGPGFGGGGFI